MKLHPVILAVTERIRERSAPTRSAYLARIAAAGDRERGADRMGCANVAHAKQILLESPGRVPQVVTTLHGTDITLVGSDRSYSETVAFSIEHSDGVTAVSESLRADTYRVLNVRHEVQYQAPRPGRDLSARVARQSHWVMELNPGTPWTISERANIGPSGWPPKMWTWRCGTSCPDRLPVLASSL